jgi:hypothetical protein
MYKFLSAMLVLEVAWLSGPGFALAADQESARQSAPLQQTERIYGSQLMTGQERAEHRSRMLSAASAEEREQIRREHHEKMRLRAEERGMALPDEPPARGRGMGPQAGVARSYGGKPPVGQQLAEVDVASQRLQSTGGIAYLSLGIGEDDPVARMSEHFNLHMVFATKGSGQYLADIRVVVEDSKGEKVFEADSPGPILYVKLPAGNYRVTASFQGTSLRKSVLVKDKRLRDAYFYWPGEDVSAARGRS